MPSELGHVLDLNFGDPLTPDGMLSQKFAAPFPSGPAAGELGWDPATVKAHFLKLRAALTMYYQGEQNLDAQFRARPGESEQYAEVWSMTHQYRAHQCMTHQCMAQRLAFGSACMDESCTDEPGIAAGVTVTVTVTAAVQWQAGPDGRPQHAHNTPTTRSHPIAPPVL